MRGIRLTAAAAVAGIAAGLFGVVSVLPAAAASAPSSSQAVAPGTVIEVGGETVHATTGAAWAGDLARPR